MNAPASATSAASTPVRRPLPVQVLDQRLGRQVAGRSRGERAAAQAARRGVEARTPAPGRPRRSRAPARPCRADGAPAARPGRRCGHRADDLRHLLGPADADGVADRHLVAAEAPQGGGDAGHGGRIDGALDRGTRTPSTRTRASTCRLGPRASSTGANA